MPPVTKSTNPTASERRAACAIAFAATLAAAARPAHAEPTTDVRACIDAATRGQTLRDEGKLLGARDAFVACVAEGCPEMVRADCAAWASQVQATIPTLVLGARDASGRDLLDVRVLADGATVANRLDGRPRALDPGPHRLRFERGDGSATTIDIVLRAGEIARAVLATFPPPSPEPSPVALGREPPSPSNVRTIALVSLGGASLVAAGGVAFFGLRARGEAEDLRARCAPACTSDDTRALRTDLTLADISIGVGVAALGALAVVALLPRSSGTVAWAGVRPVASGAGFVVGGRY